MPRERSSSTATSVPPMRRAALEAVEHREWLRVTGPLLFARYRRRVGIAGPGCRYRGRRDCRDWTAERPGASEGCSDRNSCCAATDELVARSSQDYLVDGITESLIAAMGSVDESECCRERPR